MDPDRGLPGHPGHLRTRQARADGNRQQPLDDRAALNLNRAGPDDVDANHQVDANPEGQVNEFGVPDWHTTPGRLADGYAVRGGDAVSLSYRVATLAEPPGSIVS